MPQPSSPYTSLPTGDPPQHCTRPLHHDIGRRSFLGLLGAGATSLAISPAWAADPLPRPVVTGDAALARLMAGNARWAAGKPEARDPMAGRDARARAQYPIAAIISCADSRIAPELAFDQGPGEVFVVRLAGNFANDDGIASLEYAVAVLGVPLVMVLGHSGCGAVSATIDVIRNGTILPGHLPGLIDAMRPGIEPVVLSSGADRTAADLLADATIGNVRHTLSTLADATPVLSQAIADTRVKAVGGIYDIATGKVTLV